MDFYYRSTLLFLLVSLISYLIYIGVWKIFDFIYKRRKVAIKHRPIVVLIVSGISSFVLLIALLIILIKWIYQLWISTWPLEEALDLLTNSIGGGLICICCGIGLLIQNHETISLLENRNEYALLSVGLSLMAEGGSYLFYISG